MSDPAITVLMTVYNAGRFLDVSIRSISEQTFRDFEFLIVDDASTDGSGDISEAWAKKDARIRVIRNETNKGQTPCLNQGLRLARGAWIARQDADDLSRPTRLAEQHKFTILHPEVVLLGTSGRIVDAHDRLCGLLDVPLAAESIRWTAPFLNPFIHTSVMARTDILREEFGGFDEDYRIAQDYDLWTRVIEVHPSANLRARLVCYRHLGTSLSKSGRRAAFAEAAMVSKRTANAVFGPMEPSAHALLAEFREGLTSKNRGEFWKLYARLRGVLSAGTDGRRMAALHRLKAAGAFAANNKFVAAREIFAALQTEPWISLNWLAARYLNA